MGDNIVKVSMNEDDLEDLALLAQFRTLRDEQTRLRHEIDNGEKIINQYRDRLLDISDEMRAISDELLYDLVSEEDEEDDEMEEIPEPMPQWEKELLASSGEKNDNDIYGK